MEDKGRVGGGGTDSPVPEAMGRLLAVIEERIPLETVDRIWVFPPLVRGRKEWGLVAVSCLTEDPECRDLLTARYSAELTGQGMAFESEIASEGSAPPERLPRVMDGVIRRSDLQLGEAREEKIGGDPQRFRSLLETLVDESATETS
ncbi:hypothetical protein ACFL0I_04890 [Gemmatimonadota bacterium]